MSRAISRRDVLKGAGLAGVAAALQAAGIPVAWAQQGEQLLVVQWGAAWIEVSRKLVEQYAEKSGDKITWETHAGGAMAIVAKIKPQWPRVSYNGISGWDPTFRAMINGGWVEPVRLDALPVLREIPPPV